MALIPFDLRSNADNAHRKEIISPFGRQRLRPAEGGVVSRSLSVAVCWRSIGTKGGGVGSERKNRRLQSGRGRAKGRSSIGFHGSSNLGTNRLCSLLKATSWVRAAMVISFIDIATCLASTIESSGVFPIRVVSVAVRQKWLYMA